MLYIMNDVVVWCFVLAASAIECPDGWIYIGQSSK